MQTVPSIQPLVEQLSTCFTRPSWKNAGFLMLSWLWGAARATVTEMVLASVPLPPGSPFKEVADRPLSSLYHLLDRAQWSLDLLMLQAFSMLTPWLDGATQLTVIIDDTLVRRRGHFVKGSTVSHDALAYGNKQAVDMGLNAVVLAIWIPIPAMSSGGLAVPVLMRLWRAERHCPEGTYRKRTQIAVELLQRLRRALPRATFEVVGDSEYTCREVFDGLDDRMVLCGPLPGNAAIHEPHLRWWPGKKGRKPVWGPRMPGPAELAEDPERPWHSIKVKIYGRSVHMQVKTFDMVWKSAGADRVLKLLITRDPERHLPRDGYYLCTNPLWSVEQIMTRIARRWPIETMFRTLKQELKLETIQVGFERAASRRPKPSKPGPAATPEREGLASMRLMGLGCVGYTLVVAWWLAHGDASQTLERGKSRRPWYRHKQHVSIHDMFWEFREQMRQEAFPRPQVLAGVSETLSPMPATLEAAA